MSIPSILFLFHSRTTTQPDLTAVKSRSGSLLQRQQVSLLLVQQLWRSQPVHAVYNILVRMAKDDADRASAQVWNSA